MRQIIFHEETKTFHLYNEKISYILCVLENGHLGQLYFGKRLHDKADFSYLVEKCGRPMTSYIYEWDRTFSLEHIRQEYPVYGTTDYRHPAIELLQENGSRISEFQYDSYEIIAGKPKARRIAGNLHRVRGGSADIAHLPERRSDWCKTGAFIYDF